MPRPRPSAPELPFLTTNPKEVFTRIRNYLAGRMVGATRDRPLLGEVVKCLLCFFLEEDEHSRSRIANERDAVAWYRKRIRETAREFPALFQGAEQLLLDPSALLFVHAQLCTLRMIDGARDPIGDAYEVFTGAEHRGQEGQFFTPLNAVRMLVAMVSPAPGDTVVDPACGAGGFLIATALHWRDRGIAVQPGALIGVDKDEFLSQLTAARLSLTLGAKVTVGCADSLSWGRGDRRFPFADVEGEVDVVLTNPPFGVKIVAGSEEVLREFELARKWKSLPDGAWGPTPDLASSTPPQVLFIERCVRLLRPGGRLGAIVPESLISGKSYRHVSEYLNAQGRIAAVVGLPEALFKTSGKGGTHTKTAAIVFEKARSRPQKSPERKVFFAEARWCGHDSRGRTIDRDDLPTIAARFESLRKMQPFDASHLGFTVREQDLEPGHWAPRFYDIELAETLDRLSDTHDLVSVRSLVEAGELAIASGDEVGKLAYGTGDVPFVRTSDLSGWEIKRDPKHLLSEETWQTLRAKQDVREGDILMVRDGTYLLGTCALVTRFDTRIVYQSHLYKLRVLRSPTLNPYLLLAMLSSTPLLRQIKARAVSLDIIDSLGDRILDLRLPIPRSAAVRERITELVENAIEERIVAREHSRHACEAVVNPAILDVALIKRRGRAAGVSGSPDAA